MSKEQIVRVDPAAAIPGGEVSVECAGYDTSNLRECRATFGGEEARLVGAAPWRVLAVVPEGLEEGGETEVVLESRDGQRSALSGVSGEITNPTGIAFDALGQMYVTSRLDGTVYRVTPFHEVVPFARNLGVATGLAFDSVGRMYVGDRTGTIHRVNGRGEADVWALLEPSVAAYHLAFGPDDYLYVTGPTVSSHEAVQRIDRDGRASVFFKGLGRPNGLAFDREGNLYVAASYRGRRGVIRIAPDGRDARLVVAGMNVVGLAFSAAGDMVVATNETVYSLQLGIKGTLLK